ncbi:hypothetical protein [Phyllobacterium sp. SB3]|uniref:hypothetical protein n=1 Tax=Phyllobacterium sp. SB3 TaxID=3156073 RepID=UPI0032AF80F4
MKHIKIPALLLILAAMTGTGLAGDRMDIRKRAPGEKPVQETTATVQKTVDAELRATFDAASGGVNQLTAKQAIDADWGFIADHFGEIDQDRDGHVSFAEVQDFLDARSPITAVRQRAKLQIVQ